MSVKLKVSHLILDWISSKIKTQPLCLKVSVSQSVEKVMAKEVKFPVESLAAEFEAASKTPPSWRALLQGRPSAAGSCIFMPVLDERLLC